MELFLQLLLLLNSLDLKTLSVMLDALLLRISLDGLGLEVVRDGVHLGGVDVYERGGWGVFGWDDGWGGWCAGLGEGVRFAFLCVFRCDV